MAESDTILQLGIEAAREGNREEARNLFTLLTSQDPDNVQGWLWLAGVANGPDERRAALEKVISLDPTNEMAVRGLQAMGVNPSSASTRAERAATPAPAPAAPPPAPALGGDLSDEERYAAELDSAFDDYDTVERAAPPPRNDPTPLEDAVGAASLGQEASSRRSSRGNTTTTDTTERIRTQPRRVSSRARGRDDDDDTGAAGGLGRFGGGGGLSRNVLLLIAGVLIVLVLLYFGIFAGGGGDVAQGPTPTPNGLFETPTLGGTGGLTDTVSLTDAMGLTDTLGLTNTGGLTDTGGLAPSPEPLVPTPSGPTAPADLAGANPAPVAVGTVLSANGWNYSFPNACVSSCGVAIGNQAGGVTAQGTFVVVLLFISNGTGAEQPLPADFFVLKDAQGRVYTPNPQASAGYTIRGVNADLALTDPVPANNATTSLNLVFDVQPGATNLVLFARGKTDQGFQVLNAAP